MWVRFDLAYPGSYGDLQYLMEITRNTNYFAIALDNNYMKVIINSKETTYYNNWLNNPSWRYLAVTVMKIFDDGSASLEISQSQIKIFLD